jgi:hypothetical protein
MENACDACGWVAAFGGMLAFGTFGVPIKSKVAQSLDIDPLVFQTYKTTMCFLTSWLVLLYGMLCYACMRRIEFAGRLKNFSFLPPLTRCFF